MRDVNGGTGSICRTRDLVTVVTPPWVEVTWPDCGWNFQPPLAFKLDIKELVYSFDRGMLKIK